MANPAPKPGTLALRVPIILFFLIVGTMLKDPAGDIIMISAPLIILEKLVLHLKVSVQYLFDGTKGNLRAFLGQTSLYVSIH